MRMGASMVRVALAAAVALVLVGCGGDDGSDAAAPGATDDTAADAGQDEFGEAVADAMGAGGGGSLTWDGTEHSIESVICQLDGDRVDVGTVGDGFRILISGDEPYSLQVLDPDSVQWVGERAEDGVRAGLQRAGSTFTADGSFLRVDDVEITRHAAFEIECP